MQANDLRKIYAAQVTYTQERDRRTNAGNDAARQEAARVAAAAVQAAREAAASLHVDLVRQHHAASVIQAAERCRVKCDAYIEMRWAAGMIQRVERGRRARRRRRLLEEPWVAPGMGMAAGLMPAGEEHGSNAAGALWRMLFHTAAKMAALRAVELRERGDGPWGRSVERLEEAQDLLRQARNIASPTDQVARDDDNLGRESSLNSTVELRSLAAE